MFEIPNYTGCNPEYVESSLKFFNYHAAQTLQGEEQETALETIRTAAAEWDIDLEENKQEED